MNNDSIDRLLGEYAKRPLPAGPGAMVPQVWNEIERRRRRPLWLTGFEWQGMLRRPGLVFAVGVFALVAGALPVVHSRLADRQVELVRASLHLNSFFPTSVSVLPSPSGPVVGSGR